MHPTDVQNKAEHAKTVTSDRIPHCDRSRCKNFARGKIDRHGKKIVHPLPTAAADAMAHATAAAVGFDSILPLQVQPMPAGGVHRSVPVAQVQPIPTQPMPYQAPPPFQQPQPRQPQPRQPQPQQPQPTPAAAAAAANASSRSSQRQQHQHQQPSRPQPPAIDAEAMATACADAAAAAFNARRIPAASVYQMIQTVAAAAAAAAASAIASSNQHEAIGPARRALGRCMYQEDTLTCAYSIMGHRNYNPADFRSAQTCRWRGVSRR